MLSSIHLSLLLFMNIIKDLEERGLIQDRSDPELGTKLEQGDYFYAGFDPTAPSLHLGNFLLIMTMLRLRIAGLKPIMLFGGATGQVGDPKNSEERPILSLDEIQANVNSQVNQAQAIFDRLGFDIEFVDNSEWTSPISYLGFLRDVGKHITINYMLQKETVKTRIAGEGISYTEFSYMLIQANDFLHLYKQKKCKLQIGGSDQWGNITCGLELIRKKIQAEVFGFSIPLLTKSDGKKFGKSESGAIWLDAKMTSPYQLHQFLLNTADEDAIKLITQFTFATFDEIEELRSSLKNFPQKREAQKYLADNLCTIIHGEDATTEANKAKDVLFGGSLDGISSTQLISIFKDVPSLELDKNDILSSNIIDLLVNSKACPSKGEARKLLQNGGVYINNQRINDVNLSISKEHLIDNKLLIIRTGKKSYRLLKSLD